jgi:hypothetical protein
MVIILSRTLGKLHSIQTTPTGTGVGLLGIGRSNFIHPLPGIEVAWTIFKGYLGVPSQGFLSITIFSKVI